MPYKDPEARKEYMKNYREQNKDKVREYSIKWREENKDKKIEDDKKYYQNNKNKINEYRKNYLKTENGKKSNRISGWKNKGIIHDDFDALYDKYINTNECELCKIPITEGKGFIGKKHLDHDHETGEFRNILCGNCNTNVLRNK